MGEAEHVYIASEGSVRIPLADYWVLIQHAEGGPSLTRPEDVIRSPLL